MPTSSYTPNWNQRTDIFDSITPLAGIHDDSLASTGHFRPAEWLPVQFTKTNRDAGEDAFVISAFKPVALDTSLFGLTRSEKGTVVPAGMRLQLGGSGSSGVFAGTALTYTATDVKWGVVDLVTGVTVTGAVSYTGEQVADALIERGLVRDDEAIAAGATVPATNDADLAIIVDMFISEPVGIVESDVHVWSGKAEEGDMRFHNYSKQSGISFKTRITLKVPLRAAGSTTSDAFAVATLDGGGSTAYVAGAFIDDGEYWNITNIRQLNRYSALSSSTPVVALGLSERWVARNTTRTPFTCDTDGVLTRERSSISLIAREGDWYLDSEVGVLFLHTDTWATQVAAAATVTFSYDFYTDTGVAGAHKFIHFEGPCQPGKFVYYDSKSNFVQATSTQVGNGLAIGRIHKIAVEPMGYLDKVKTAWGFSGADATSKMPGSATGGFSDLITHSQETVADTLVQLVIDIP